MKTHRIFTFDMGLLRRDIDKLAAAPVDVKREFTDVENLP